MDLTQAQREAVYAEINQVANAVIAGLYGNGKARIIALTKAGYDYDIVQAVVNYKLRMYSTVESV